MACSKRNLPLQGRVSGAICFSGAKERPPLARRISSFSKEEFFHSDYFCIQKASQQRPKPQIKGMIPLIFIQPGSLMKNFIST